MLTHSRQLAQTSALPCGKTLDISSSGVFPILKKIFKGEVDLNPSDFFLGPPRSGLRGHTYRLLKGPSRRRRRSGAFSVRVVKHWNRLSTPDQFPLSLFSFKMITHLMHSHFLRLFWSLGHISLDFYVRNHVSCLDIQGK